MFEKISVGYTELVDGSKFWHNDFGEMHKKYGPASIEVSGIMSWWEDGDFIKSINVEDDDVQIEEILNEINFNKIHKAMRHLDWKWGLGDNAIVPNVHKLKEEAHRLLNQSKKYRNSEIPIYISCGGFEVYAYKGGFALKFVLEHWSTDE
jgi:hypothetical protein